MVSQLEERSVNDSASSAAVVVSAMGAHPSSPVKVTDLLLSVVSKAAARDASFPEDLAALRAKHVETADELLLSADGGADGKAEREAFVASLDKDVEDLRAVLQAISIAGGASSSSSASGSAFADYVVGHGELWSARLFAAALRARLGADAGVLDAREVLVVTPTPDGTSVDVEYAPSEAALDAWGAKEAETRRKSGGGVGSSSSSQLPRIVVVTGFVARTADGQPTTLRRNGSDYSATIIGALFKSSSIVIWTDVDGVYSADPRKVAEAVCLESLSYQEAWELAYFGASVLHPRTTQPAMRENIPVSIRNFFNLKAPGTVIRADPSPEEAAAEKAAKKAAAAAAASSKGGKKKRSTAAGGDGMVKGFATIDGVALINVEGTGMVRRRREERRRSSGLLSFPPLLRPQRDDNDGDRGEKRQRLHSSLLAARSLAARSLALCFSHARSKETKEAKLLRFSSLARVKRRKKKTPRERARERKKKKNSPLFPPPQKQTLTRSASQESPRPSSPPSATPPATSS